AANHRGAIASYGHTLVRARELALPHRMQAPRLLLLRARSASLRRYLWLVHERLHAAGAVALDRVSPPDPAGRTGLPGQASIRRAARPCQLIRRPLAHGGRSRLLSGRPLQAP